VYFSFGVNILMSFTALQDDIHSGCLRSVAFQPILNWATTTQGQDVDINVEHMAFSLTHAWSKVVQVLRQFSHLS
jgi:acetolactate synthase small subunit